MRRKLETDKARVHIAKDTRPRAKHRLCGAQQNGRPSTEFTSRSGSQVKPALAGCIDAFIMPGSLISIERPRERTTFQRERRRTLLSRNHDKTRHGNPTNQTRQLKHREEEKAKKADRQEEDATRANRQTDRLRRLRGTRRDTPS